MYIVQCTCSSITHAEPCRRQALWTHCAKTGAWAEAKTLHRFTILCPIAQYIYTRVSHPFCCYCSAPFAWSLMSLSFCFMPTTLSNVFIYRKSLAYKWFTSTLSMSLGLTVWLFSLHRHCHHRHHHYCWSWFLTCSTSSSAYSFVGFVSASSFSFPI